jgi:hypothetical protein
MHAFFFFSTVPIVGAEEQSAARGVRKRGRRVSSSTENKRR